MGQRLTQYFNWHSNHFFPFYLSEHQNPNARLLHFGSAAAGAAGLAATLATGTLWFLAAGIAAGYLQAWIGHEKYENNIPATFKAPLGSLLGDYMMAGLWLMGRLEHTMKEYGLDPTGKDPALKQVMPYREFLAQLRDSAHKPEMIEAQRGKTIISSLRDRLSL